ncbi:MAG: NUDIX hydrolase [Chlamydiia bacterium]|nr:NUDIX hydrolase [Chlamydiia bacterium]
MIETPDGRILLAEPTNHFAGYQRTFPKGRIDNGETPRETAVREAEEESGFQIQLTGYLGDFKGSSTITRYYRGRIVRGSPDGCDWETMGIYFVPRSEVFKELKKNKNPVLADVFQAYEDNYEPHASDSSSE